MVSEWDPLGVNGKVIMFKCLNHFVLVCVCVLTSMSIFVCFCAGSDAETQGRESGTAKDSNWCPPGAPWGV